MLQQENLFPKAVFSHQIVWLLRIDFPSLCGLCLQFSFSKGKHLQSIDELLFVDPTVTGATWWRKPHYQDGNVSANVSLRCKLWAYILLSLQILFSKPSSTFRTSNLSPVEWISPFGSKLIQGGSVVKEPAFHCRSHELDPWVGRSTGGDGPTPVFLPGKPHGQRRLAGYSPRGRKRIRRDVVTKRQEVR